ncbi:MAG TPA: adenylyl-sulfate kinase, partial [Burkholderiaceae bacterium]|nr:adenylyl-sulfate kinase [Burkholderiaceae bacterium]
MGAITRQALRVGAQQREAALGQRALTLWLTGLPGAGKSTLAAALDERLFELGRHSFVLDGDNLRHGLCSDLGFSAADRHENIRRVAEVARLLNDAGLIVIAALVSPYRADRDLARRVIGSTRFAEVHVAAPLAVCEARDPKGLYRKARAGLMPGLTGIDAPYEVPLSPSLTLDTSTLSVNASLQQ